MEVKDGGSESLRRQAEEEEEERNRFGFYTDSKVMLAKTSQRDSASMCTTGFKVSTNHLTLATKSKSQCTSTQPPLHQGLRHQFCQAARFVSHYYKAGKHQGRHLTEGASGRFPAGSG